jgi:hypothetical protein
LCWSPPVRSGSHSRQQYPDRVFLSAVVARPSPVFSAPAVLQSAPLRFSLQFLREQCAAIARGFLVARSVPVLIGSARRMIFSADLKLLAFLLLCAGKIAKDSPSFDPIQFGLFFPAASLGFLLRSGRLQCRNQAARFVRARVSACSVAEARSFYALI